MSLDVQESDSDLAELPEYELEQNSDGTSLQVVRKAVQHRMRLSWKQRALTVHHFNTTIPRPTLEELAEWCKQEVLSEDDRTPLPLAYGCTKARNSHGKQKLAAA